MSKVEFTAQALAGLAAATLLSLALIGCAGPKPPPEAAESPLAQADVPSQLPLPGGTSSSADDTAPAWRSLVRSPWLGGLVDQALAHNRDLSVAMLNVERAQAQLALSEANRWPSVGVGLNASRAPLTSGPNAGKEATSLTAGIQLSAWEIDLFGRLSSLSDAARAQLLASTAGRRAAELVLTAAVLQAGLALQADTELLDITQRSLDSRQESLRLTSMREAAGAASQVELQAQQGLVAQTRASLAQLTRQQAQDRNALGLLLGGSAAAIPEPPAAPRLADEAWFAEVPVGLSSEVLLRRPDVAQAEQAMRAAQANLSAARAALFPSITLTAQAGQASAQLAGLFQSGHFGYAVAASLVQTIFDAGRRNAGIASADSAQRIAQAQYERAIQAAFADTADALAGLATWRDQAQAQAAATDAARQTLKLTQLRARQGAASTLEQLDAERSVLSAEQALLQARLGELANRVALFKALGG